MFGVSSFIPEIDEPSLNKEEVNLCSNPERGRLFRGKIFVFFNSKQVKPTNPYERVKCIQLKGTVLHFIRLKPFS